jgi:hypothetical protein
VVGKETIRTKNILDRYIKAVLYPTYANVRRALRGMARKPNAISEVDMEEFMDRMKLPNAKYGFMSMLLARDYSFLNSSDNNGKFKNDHSKTGGLNT